MRREHKTSKTVIPKPFFEIGFSCSNRSFFDVLNDVVDIMNPLIDEDRENAEDYICQKCDYEGDLEELVISDTKYIKVIVAAYGLTPLPDGVDLHLSCY